jgi:hypothetical protein
MTADEITTKIKATDVLTEAKIAKEIIDELMRVHPEKWWFFPDVDEAIQGILKVIKRLNLVKYEAKE